MAGNFIAMVYAVLRDKGVDTKGMDTDEAVAKYEELTGKTGRYNVATGEKEKGDKKQPLAEYAHSKNGTVRNSTDDNNKGGGTDEPIKFRKSASKEFKKLIEQAKESNSPETRWRVDIHDEADYLHDKLFVTDGGSTVAVEPDGNIISVCKNQTENIRGSVLLKKAVESGGDRLDAFGEDLYAFYTRNGFEPISYTPFDEQYAPEGWQKGRDKPEPVVFYKYTGSKCSLSYKEFISQTKPMSNYDAAKSVRDKEIKK